jgi:hypothetical protein
MCAKEDAAFYESKFTIDGFSLSVFNYRLAQYKDFVTPLESKPNVKAYEMRGLTFVFNQDGSLFKRFLLLEKFFNLNQVPESMYSIVKDYKIKWVNNKEDGSIASYIQLPNGKVLGKSKMGFDNEQANGINRIYKTITDVKTFLLEVYDAKDAIADMTQGIIKNIIISKTLEECTHTDIDSNLTKKVRSEIKKWGVDIQQVTLTDVAPVRSIRLINDGFSHKLD